MYPGTGRKTTKALTHTASDRSATGARRHHAVTGAAQMGWMAPVEWMLRVGDWVVSRVYSDGRNRLVALQSDVRGAAAILHRGADDLRAAA